ncbi:DUF2523 domain-containing protein [Comamonas aquatica]|jgi:hypothetical protein|uniref:Protein of uncharacterized function (DUF2523) n=2 Tax=Comamonas aquatica TaxID=225991 RepID=A0AA35D8T0_9BURK|nr:DUF2523 domain-containing protein [Comamonas aquatica]MDH0495775.1 DUF2523 domain-containing protein [Comamonas aquatica]MDH0496370.1 DUF2523 domain-containing protein [Comamonas aquatica]MDH0496378.1 DUF2523 domain-containing protein [Comamonas aquatica]MDH0901348.1 DUF2523 domain-containing protein [Comamonas aquatica]QTX22232.1 DUF2523 domain-containing protein [Comamonas aquatica]
MKLGTWLLSMMQPLIGRILAALGFSVVTITGFELVIDTVKNMVRDGINTLPADMLNLFLYAGGGQGLGMILGAITTKLLLWQVQRATQILGRNPG